MPADKIPWPHAPEHHLAMHGTYFVTASSYLHQHHFKSKERLAVLHRGLLKVAADFGWQLEAWQSFLIIIILSAIRQLTPIRRKVCRA